MTVIAKLLDDIHACRACEQHLPHGPRPVIQAHSSAQVLIIGQAPGAKVHDSGIAWMDASGKQLRKWLNVDETAFYDPTKFALMPMGFCFPGKGRSGDLPPRPECASLWHNLLLRQLKQVRLTLLIGQFAQHHYLGDERGTNLTETVRAFRQYLPKHFPLPHPSPRNRFWIAKNPWFALELLPRLQASVADALV